MAKIHFKNSHELINHLCRADVLGQLQVSFTQKQTYVPEPTFNFEYPALEEHLYYIFSEVREALASSVEEYFIFEDAEEVDIKAGDDLQNTDNELYKIEQFIVDIMDEHYEKEVYSLITIEGPNYEIKSWNIEKFEIYDYNDEEKPLQISSEIKNQILMEIRTILEDTRTCIEEIEWFYLEVNGEDNINYQGYGMPYVDGWYDFEDGKTFEFDSGHLKPTDNHVYAAYLDTVSASK